jgi:hypothetical protein
LEEKKSNTRFKKIRKIVFRTFIVLVLLLLILGITLSLPSVQSKIAHYFTEKINKDYGTDINVEEVEVSIFGGVHLKKVLVRDEKKDTLIVATRIKTSILDFKRLIDGNLIFGTIDADNLKLKVITYKGDKDTNLDKFVAAFDDGKKSTGKFLLTSKKITLVNSRFTLYDYNRQVPLDVDFTDLNAVVTDFQIKGPNVTTSIDKMSFKENHGLVIEDLNSKFTYTKKNIKLEKLAFNTKNSQFKGDVILKYDRKDFTDFNNKVIFDINTEKATIASNDIRYFYKEIGENQLFDISGKIDGTLNDLTAKNLVLKDNKNSEIIGDVNFKNLFQKQGKGDFYMKGTFDKVSSNYDDLTALLPNVLGKKLPSSLSKLGQFNLRGKAEITTKSIDTDFDLSTRLGNVKSKMIMTNIDAIDNAKYVGNIQLNQFNLGSFLNRKELGIVSLNIDVDGKGFTEKYLDTKMSGSISNFTYNGYTYKNIIADGKFKKPIFEGKVNINDSNLFLDFDGKVDLSKKENIYDFHAKVDYANLKNLHFINDNTSVFRGDVVMKVSGSTINNLKGDVIVTNASYQNQKDIYFFDNVTVNSQFDQFNERTISLYSPNEIRGEVVGKFDFNQIYKIVQNSLGSLYTNYRPNNVSRGQYLRFNFSEFNKIIEIFRPDISISEDALLNGSISADTNDFKVNFSSNSIAAFNTQFDKIQVEIDNKNPLYNAYIQLDSIKTKNYKIRDFSLINVTSNDTLHFRTEFKGGKEGNDFYNLNLFHTIDKNKNNIVGFKNSEMMFKDFLWNVNAKDNEKNKIIFDKTLTNFTFDDILISHDDQSMLLSGILNGKGEKNLNLVFNNVDLNKITPDVNKFKFQGFVDGEVNILQVNSVYKPTSNLKINRLEINDNLLGDMTLDVEGDENFKKFLINSNIENENLESFNALGNLEIVNEEAILDLVLNFKKFNLGVLSNLGGDVIKNIRGSVSGSARLDGNINDIDYNGRLFLEKAGLTIPYLNVDYELEENSIVDVTQSKFIIQRTTIFDTKFNSKGIISGFIKHKKFGEWELDLDVSSNRLLALNTIDTDDAAYYGTAYINGTASIHGPTDGLIIDVIAKSEKGTDIKIPINDADAVDEKEYIHFKTEDEKYNKITDAKEKEKKYNGLELNFEFDITPDANIEVILDRASGHGMKGNGKGGLLFRINTLGKFEMFGDFVVDKGSYNFKYGGLFDKKFAVKKNGYIAWEGDPYRAVLDLQAVYETTANPAVLINNSSINKKVPVEVTIDLKGTINNPEPDFIINLPTVTSTLKSEIQAVLDDPSTRQTQALALLSTGSFITAENASNAAYGSLFETAGGLISGIFGNKDDKLQLGLGYTQADRTPGLESDPRVVATISTKINDRIIINGVVGVPVGGINESAVVGNFELLYRVNEDGTLNLKVFNRENDINYIGQGIGYTQGVGLNYEVDFDTFKELINKIFTKHKIEVEKKTNEVDDSNYLPEYIKLDGENPDKDKKEQNHNNKEAIPLDD